MQNRDEAVKFGGVRYGGVLKCASARFLKISLRVLEWIFVNSVKIDGDGEASDFEKDEVENDFYLSISKNTIQSFRHLAFSESGACLKQFTGFNLTSKLQEVQV